MISLAKLAKHQTVLPLKTHIIQTPSVHTKDITNETPVINRMANVAIKRQPRRFDIVLSELKTYRWNVHRKTLIFSEIKKIGLQRPRTRMSKCRECTDRRVSVSFLCINYLT